MDAMGPKFLQPWVFPSSSVLKYLLKSSITLIKSLSNVFLKFGSRAILFVCVKKQTFLNH